MGSAILGVDTFTADAGEFSMTENTVVRLASRPVGMVVRENFDIGKEPIPEPGEGENEHAS